MSIRINVHGVVGVAALSFLWWNWAHADLPSAVTIYFACASVLYAILILANVDNVTSRVGSEAQLDTSFKRLQVAWGAHLFLFLIVVSPRFEFVARLGLVGSFAVAITTGLAVPFMLVRRVAMPSKVAVE